jgi:hypothetical protein
MVGPKISQAIMKLPRHVKKLVHDDVGIEQLEKRIHHHLDHLMNPPHMLGEHYYYVWTPLVLLFLVVAFAVTLWKCCRLRSVAMPQSTTKSKESPEIPELIPVPEVPPKSSQTVFGE